MAIADYDITVAGELAPEFAVAFAPHTITTSDGRTTVHTEHLDDAALFALLHRMSDLALAIVRLERLDARRTAAHG